MSKIDLKRVQSILRVQGKSQVDLAKYLGISSNTMVSIFKSGVCKTDQLEKILKFINTDISAIMKDREEIEGINVEGMKYKSLQMEQMKLLLKIKEDNNITDPEDLLLFEIMKAAIYEMDWKLLLKCYKRLT